MQVIGILIALFIIGAVVSEGFRTQILNTGAEYALVVVAVGAIALVRASRK